MFKKFIKKMLGLSKTPSQYFREYIGAQLCIGFKVGEMKGKLNGIHNKRQKYILGWHFNTEYKPVLNAVITMRSTIARYEDDF